MNPKKRNILNHIKSSGSGFKTPEGYFDSLEKRFTKKSLINNSTVENDSSEINELSHLESDLWNSVKKNSGFKVPDGYFDEFELPQERPARPKVIRFKARRLAIVSLSLAASILMFFGINYFVSEQNTFNQLVLEENEITSWIDNDLVSFDSYEIADTFNDVDLEQTVYLDQDVDDYFDFLDIEQLLIEN